MTVSAEVPLVETTTADLGRVLSNQTMRVETLWHSPCQGNFRENRGLDSRKSILESNDVRAILRVGAPVGLLRCLRISCLGRENPDPGKPGERQDKPTATRELG